MKAIAIQPYYKMIREVSSLRQRNRKDHREIRLYKQKITTKYRQFKIEDVQDMSFRPIGGEGGLFYLHTIKGVFSYHVEESPKQFITIFKEKIK